MFKTTGKIIAITLVILMNMGLFVVPTQAKADWQSILGQFGFGGGSNSYNQGYGYNSYDYNSTDAYNNGDIKISKEVRQVGNSKYHDKITIRSGALVEVMIEVKNTSSKYNADTIVRDEMGGNTVYSQNSLRVNGQTAQPGLTSGGLHLNLNADSKALITYQMYVCGNSGYPMRAYASAPAVGAATDAIIIYTESFSVGYYDDTYSCMAQYQNQTGGGQTYGNQTVNAGNPFGDWTGVDNSANTTVDSPANNPFDGWTGVNNFDSTPINNSDTSNSTDPFGDWYGVQNMTQSNPFGDWYGSAAGNYQQSDPFGDWTGVNSGASEFDARGYSQSYAIAQTTSANRSVTYASAPTNFVAPTTGVEKSAPFVFAALVTLGFLAYRKRKLLFN